MGRRIGSWTPRSRNVSLSKIRRNWTKVSRWMRHYGPDVLAPPVVVRAYNMEVDAYYRRVGW